MTIKSSKWQDEYQKMIDDCEKRESRISEWEQGFVDSVGSQLGRGRHLSQRQIETLEKIWERVTRHG